MGRSGGFHRVSGAITMSLVELGVDSRDQRQPVGEIDKRTGQ
jgi:hypothetical protein